MATKTATPIKISATGQQLPPEWAKQAGVAPDETIEVIIRPDREQAAKELREVAARMRKEAKEKGLTEDKLVALLKDD